MKDNLFKTRQEIADELSISVKTLHRWTQKHQLNLPKGLLCPKFQQLIKETVLFEKADK